MQLKIERGPAATGKTIRLHQIAKADGQGEQQILNGRNTTQLALERQVMNLVSRGATVICIDDCSEDQIKSLQALTRKRPLAVVIHAVVGN